jgi:hypothetical protein
MDVGSEERSHFFAGRTRELDQSEFKRSVFYLPGGKSGGVSRNNDELCFFDLSFLSERLLV